MWVGRMRVHMRRTPSDSAIDDTIGQVVSFMGDHVHMVDTTEQLVVSMCGRLLFRSLSSIDWSSTLREMVVRVIASLITHAVLYDGWETTVVDRLLSVPAN